ncbi:SRPBCC family protein [Streptomyces sp. NPDC018031]|uniref:SRPBCC family protein n=1 Tax=Streptomyces sp. NPDC018031 TaxID=3365033 RepID=UPI0037B2E013
MEHEVFVPYPVDTVRRALSDPARVARSVPGLQQDAERSSGPVAGRLRVRVGGHTITYRGSLGITPRDDSFEVEGEGSEVRGDGSVKFALTVTPTAADGGTRLVCSGTLSCRGRLAEFDDATTEPVARRLLDRFGAGLGEGIKGRAEDREGGPEDSAAPTGPARTDDAAAGAAGTEDGTAAGAGGTGDDAAAGAPEPAGSAEGTSPRAGGGGAAAGTEDEAEPEPPADAGPGAVPARPSSVFDAEVPPPSLDPLSDADAADDADDADDAKDPGARAGIGPDDDVADADDVADMDDVADADDEGFEVIGGVDGPDGVAAAGGVDGVDPLAPLDGGDEPPAEAAHARRTMIGRSTEEVDHAPPRGRYAPVPAADAAPGTATLRWAAPAAAFVLASAVVVGRRVLRRRR